MQMNQQFPQISMYQNNGMNVPYQVPAPKIIEPCDEFTLFVSNMGQSTRQFDVFNIFSNYGPIVSCRLLVDTATSKSKCCAYVSFTNKKSSDRALQEVNGRTISDYDWSVAYKIPSDPHDRMKPKIAENTNFFLTKLDERMNGKDVLNFCRERGFVPVRSMVLYNREKMKNRESKKMAYVQFLTSEEGARFKEFVNSNRKGENDIQVEDFKPEEQREKKDKLKNNLIITGFPEDYTKEQVEEFLQKEVFKFGEVVSHASKFNRKLRRFAAYVTFTTEESANSCLLYLEALQIVPGENVGVSFCMTSKEINKFNKEMYFSNDRNIIITMLRSDVSIKDLRSVLEKFGKIERMGMKRQTVSIYPNKKYDKTINADQLPKKDVQIAFVLFENSAPASQIINNTQKIEDIVNLTDPDINDFTSPFAFLINNKRKREEFKKFKEQSKLNAEMKKNQMQNQFENGRFQKGQRGGRNNYVNQINTFAFPNMTNIQLPINSYNPIMMTDTPSRGGSTSSSKHAEQVFVDKGLKTVDLYKLPRQQIAHILEKNFAELEKMSTEDQMELLGSIIYFIIENYLSEENKTHVSQITGMLLDFEVLTLRDMVSLVSNEQDLKERIEEALDLILQGPANESEGEAVSSV